MAPACAITAKLKPAPACNNSQSAGPVPSRRGGFYAPHPYIPPGAYQAASVTIDRPGCAGDSAPFPLPNPVHRNEIRWTEFQTDEYRKSVDALGKPYEGDRFPRRRNASALGSSTAPRYPRCRFDIRPDSRTNTNGKCGRCSACGLVDELAMSSRHATPHVIEQPRGSGSSMAGRHAAWPIAAGPALATVRAHRGSRRSQRAIAESTDTAAQSSQLAI
jgi:hypothetical protein